MPEIEIIIKGKIDPDWSDWFEDLTISSIEREKTQLSGHVADQSALYGIISRLSRLGLPLISIQNLTNKEEDVEITK